VSRFMAWTYHDDNSRAVFQHYRVEDPADPRGKRYGYRVPVAFRNGVVKEWDYRKPAIADSLIYRLPLVLANPDARLLLVEGERDACALLQRRILASSHHGGAGKFTEAMAKSLAGHRGRIVLVADNDAAGAYDVCRRFDLLRAVGIPAARLRVREVVPAHAGADMRDHLAAGYRLRDLRRADLGRLREVAAAATTTTFTGCGYVAPEIKRWRPWPTRPSTKGA
jgi:hypothetical protein